MSKRPTEYGRVLSHIGVQETDAYTSNVKIGGMCIKGGIDNKTGEVQINPNVVASYAGAIAVGCFDIVNMVAVSMKDELVRLLKRESLIHDINVIINDNRISFGFHAIVSCGVSIFTTSDNLTKDMKYRVEEPTDMEAEKINIFVESVGMVGQEEITCEYKYD